MVPLAKWGAACAQCSNAKAKCLRSNSDPTAKCDRCQRLLKDCSRQVHHPRKKRTSSRPSRTSQVEQKLNGLVSLLKSSGDLSNIDLSSLELDDGISHLQAGSDPSVTSQTTSPSTISEPPQPRRALGRVPTTYNANGPASCICRADNSNPPPPPDTDENLLQNYRKLLQPVYPFVIVPENLSAAALDEKRPFLLSAIRMVTSFRSLRSMRAQMYTIMTQISERMLIKSERSMDLLLGILVTVGWYHYHCLMHSQLNTLISLATTLVFELGLNRHPHINDRTALMVMQPNEPLPRTNEEKRAYAGVWFMSSAMSTGFWTIEPMRHTKYLQNSVKELEADLEFETDARLVTMMRVQHLSQRISNLYAIDEALDSDASAFPKAPLTAYVSAFQHDLHALETAMPQRIRKDEVLRIQLAIAKLRLYQPPVLDHHTIQSMSETLTSCQPGAGTTLDQLYQSAAAIRGFFGAWLAAPASSYHYFPTYLMSQMVYGLTMLGRWSKLIAPLSAQLSKPPTLSTDPSAGNPNYARLVAETGNAVATRSDLPTPAELSTRRSQSSSSVRPQEPAQRQTESDPRLSVAISALRSQLHSQPGLIVDVSTILSAVGEKFEEVNKTLMEISTDSGATQLNIWTMGTMKLRITQARLGRWAELVTETEKARVGKSTVEAHDGNTSSSGTDEGIPAQPLAEGGIDTWDPYDQSIMAEFGGPWAEELFQGMDIMDWHSDFPPVDWGTIMMSSVDTTL